MDEIKLTFDKSVKEDILDLLDKAVDKEGMIVEKSTPNQRVLTFDSQEISFTEFGGVKRGSEVFISDNLVSLMRFIKRD